MKWRDVVFLVCALVLSVALLAVAHYEGDPGWLRQHLPPASGGGGIMWQVQTTFLSVGFAGLAIAAQLFAEAPLAIGASRARVLDYIRAGWFVGVGLVANAVIAIETIWLPSGLGALGIALLWFTPTVVMLVVSTVRLMQLFGRPSLLDEVVRVSLVESLASRLDLVSRKYADARKQLDGLVTSGWSIGSLRPTTVTLRVPVPQVGLVIKAIKPKALRRALDSLGPRAIEAGSAESEGAELYTPPEITLDVEPGDRTRLGETAFRISTSEELDEADQGRLVRLLQSSIEFEPPGTVTPDEETDREIANLKDAIGISLRSGAFATAERALDLLGHVVRGVWMAQPESMDSSHRASFIRRDWLLRSIGEVEQDVLLSPRVAGLFVSAAMTRALEAPRTGSSEYVDECLRSFTRTWVDVLRHEGTEFDPLLGRIITCVQNLAAYSVSAPDQRQDLPARATWAMVELVKLALDAKKPEAAKRTARELSGLFEHSEGGTGRAHVRAGQLVLSGWLDYLSDKADDRDPADAELRAGVTPRGTWAEILAARSLAERGEAPFSRWDWWEMQFSGSAHAQVLELSHYIDRAQLAALAASHGPLPRAGDQETASEYKRFLRLLDEAGKELSTGETTLKLKFADEIAKWDAAEGERLADESLSAARAESLRTALRDTLGARQRLAAEISVVESVPDGADTSRPILGMNFKVSRHYLVEKVFNQTYADPKDLGQMIAQRFAEGEEHKIVGELRSLQEEVLDPTALEIRKRIEALGDDAEHFVLVTPYGGLEDIHEWYSIEFRDVLERVIHVETSVLDTEAILFDRRSTLTSCRVPEAKEGLMPVEGTTIAIGIFEDVHGGDEPQVRIETGEYFVVWAGGDPRIIRFGTPSTDGSDDAPGGDDAVENPSG